ncbi:hypothetical protein D0865_09921 [Hortaea werneckii]|uniref:Ribosomal protein/NADH dehydrogenase domain-containing protein n=1 Tax=Hortaea werneckii TaxID=91943 RepID=A0A3M7C035_HORWE|nr:hypothetical protein D0865_09921 [Hortaea werneckii]
MSGKYVFSKALKELRFHHCQTSDHSNAIRRRRTDTSSSHDANRSFLTRAYPTMKHHNPHTPILIREAMNIQPRVFARYEFGKEKMADLQGMWEGEMERWREAFMSREVGRESGKIARSMDRGLDDKAIEDKVSGLVQASQSL